VKDRKLSGVMEEDSEERYNTIDIHYVELVNLVREEFSN